MKEKILKIINKYLKYIELVIIVILIIIIGFLYGDNVTEEEVIKEVEVKEEKEEVKETLKFKVDIKGQVKNPGVYEIEENKRIIDQTTPNMIQRLSGIFARNPLIYEDI